MATRTKTVQFVYGTESANVAANTTHTFTGESIYLPEDGIVFQSVMLIRRLTDDVTSATDTTQRTLGIKLGAVAEDTDVVGATISNSGESNAFEFSRDCTAYFTANWTGTSMTWEASYKATTPATANHSVVLLITYDYDDTSATQIKTIWLPIESTLPLITTSYQNLGGSNVIPAFNGGALPEDTPVVRQAWVELWGNAVAGSTTDFALDVRLATELGEQLSLWREEAALATPLWCHAIWDITIATFAAAQHLEVKCTGVTDRFRNLGGWIAVTYEFNAADTTTVWNSVFWSPWSGVEDQHAHASSSNRALFVRDFWIEEPATIETMGCAAMVFWSQGVSGTSVSVWTDNQSEVAYAVTGTAFQTSVVHRIDAGGAEGFGVALARGRNTIKINAFGNSSSHFFGLNGVVLLNYKSGKHALGVGVHNQSRHFILGVDRGASGSTQTLTTVTPAIPEAAYFLNGIALNVVWPADDVDPVTVDIAAEFGTGEGPDADGVGWATLLQRTFRTAGSAENVLTSAWGDCTSAFKQWTGSVDAALMDLEVARTWRVHGSPQMYTLSAGMWVTWHAITFTASGNVRGFTADGSGLTVSLSRAADGKRLVQDTTAIGGAYSAIWFDNTELLVADCYQDDAHVGRSIPFLAV